MTRFAWMLSMAIGFLSLGQEILWVRIISFISKGVSQSFALVLFFFLFGIAIGSAIGKRFCERDGDLVRTSAAILAVAAIVDTSLVLMVPMLIQWRVGLIGVLLLVAITAALKSVMFPIAHHLGSQQSGSHVGRSVSKVYFGNIVGSTLGPIVTGYVLLDYITVDHALLLVAMATGALSLLCAIRARAFESGLVAVAIIVAVQVLIWSGSANMVASMASATQRSIVPGYRVEDVIQNRHGIVHTVSSTDGLPIQILGGNMHDGRVSVDMNIDSNGLERALVLLAVHPKPERVLVIGLSTGAWARILLSSPRVKELTVVEINPGYLQLIARYPSVTGLLSDPRVKIVIDDGRRWMRRNKDEKFDLIIQNNTFSWRAYSTNLLSREYMQLVASHLRPNGIAAFNSTGSSDVLQTARDVFFFVERRINFVYASATDFSRAVPGAVQAYQELDLNGSPVFTDAAYAAGGVVRNMVDTPFMPPEQQLVGLSVSPGVVTDQNMLVEHAHGKAREFLPRLYLAVDGVRAWLRKL